MPESPLNKTRSLLLLASFLSGVAALVYQLLWIRELSLIAGSTQAAISIVLSVFFLGLAIGSFLASRIAGRWRRPLVIYMVAELVIAIWALLFYPLLGAMDGVYESMYQSLPPGSALIHIIRLCCSAALLLVPSTCMGITIPILAQIGACEVGQASRWSAKIYGINTLGAMVGTFLAGFVLVEHFGVSTPAQANSLLNIACALLVVPLISRRPVEQIDDGPSRPRIRPLGALLLVCFGILGFANIGAEVVWTRFYALMFWNDTYLFTLILMIYLFGLGIGSLVGTMLVRDTDRSILLLGMTQLISAIWMVVVMYAVPKAAAWLYPGLESFSDHMTMAVLCVVGGILIPTLCMGMSFPLLVRAALVDPHQTGNFVGRALAWNTLGGVLGAAVAGFVLLDRLGLQWALLLITALTAAVGLILWRAAPNSSRWPWRLALGLIVPVVAVLYFWPPRLPQALVEANIHANGYDQKILDTSPSIYGTVTVTEDVSGERVIWINNEFVARETGHLQFGYVPWLLHPGLVERSLGICCGTGRTFGALHNVGISKLDLVEINPSVIRLTNKWLSRSNNNVLSDESVRVILDDGRNYVRYTDQKYDLITLEPLQMYQKGTVNFYTDDFYREAKRRMNDGGILCQWFPIYLMSLEEARSMANTFVKVFPNSLLWANNSDAMLLGYNLDSSAEFDRTEILGRLSRESLRAQLEQAGCAQLHQLMSSVLLDGDGLRSFSEGAIIYTDDRPTLEFTAPRLLGSNAYQLTAKTLGALREHLVPLEQVFRLSAIEAELLNKFRAANVRMKDEIDNDQDGEDN